MIQELHIRGLGVIDEATVVPGPGFTALTGETGAGKTLVLTALGMLLGGRVDAALAENASVDGLFSLPASSPAMAAVAEAGGSTDSGELVIARAVANGRMRAVAGGRTVPAALLSDIAEDLVVVHGQATQQRLRQPAAQRAALDRFGGDEHAALLAGHREAFRRWRELEQAWRMASDRQEQIAGRISVLRVGLEGIERVDPQVGESDELRVEQTRLANVAELQMLLGQATEAVVGDDSGEQPGAAGLLAAARRAVAAAARLDPSAESAQDRLIAAFEEVADIGYDLSGLRDGLVAEPGRLEWVSSRLHTLAGLRSRFGTTEVEVLEWARQAAIELTDLERSTDLAGLQQQVADARTGCDDLAGRITSARQELAGRLAAAATAELRDLAMPHAEITIVVTDGEHGPEGRDDVAFFLAAHPGAAASPLSRGASGGELSRVMLALEVVLADTRTGRTFVFDEVDAGVGGAAATAIGRRLARLGRNAQVIVVTHMPQVAAFAQTHLRVLKDQQQGVTTSDVSTLDPRERVVEIARMLAGQEDSRHARAHAQELLALGEQP